MTNLRLVSEPNHYPEWIEVAGCFASAQQDNENNRRTRQAHPAFKLFQFTALAQPSLLS